MQQSQALSASQQSFSNFFVIFSLALFMKVVCQNTVPLIATPFLSVLFPVGCFALTHQVKTQNMRWEHLALAVEPCQGEKFQDIRSAFPPPLHGTFLWDVQGFLPQPPGWPAAPSLRFALSNTITVCKCLKAVSFELATCFKLLCG